jgi:hypothetical protein
MANRIDAVTVDMAELNEQEKELKALCNARWVPKKWGKFRGMGGSDAILSRFQGKSAES